MERGRGKGEGEAWERLDIRGEKRGEEERKE